MNESPLILLTNDDGIHSAGIKALHESLAKIAQVVVVAPLKQHSATGQSITVFTPLKITEFHHDSHGTMYGVRGTPTDCVKIAIKTVLPRKPDIVMSGINRGENTGYNIIYSGTVAAAREGAMLGIPSAAISLASPRYDDFSLSAHFGTIIAKHLLTNTLPLYTLLNINIPALPSDQVKEVRITRQGYTTHHEFYEETKDHSGTKHYWLAGKKHENGIHDDPSFDTTAIKHNAISVTPLHYQQTNDAFLNTLNSWNIEF
ncbi:MAG: 5'/3'-nucleotidase SurE [bacterium]|nr:5'/3'-nucleotidase SurE [bacterium]